MEFTAKNIANYVPSNYTISTIQNFGRTSSSNIYKRKSRKTTHSICRKNSQNNKASKNLPGYILQPKHALQKQNILFEIKKVKQKAINQELINKKLVKKLQKKQSQNFFAFNLSKQNFFRTTQQSKNNSTLAYNFKAGQIHQKNLQKSINEQLASLKQQVEKNKIQIERVKRSKKYTKFMEVLQQKNICLKELKQLKTKIKFIRSQIIKKKRQNRQIRKRKIDILVMEGQVQDNLQKENIQIYRKIQQVNQKNRQAQMKKISLKQKKKKLLMELQNMKKNYYENKIASHSKKSTAVTNIDYWSPYGNRLQELKEQSEEDQSFAQKRIAQRQKTYAFDKKSQFKPLEPKIQRKFQTQDFQGVSNQQIKDIQRKYFQNEQEQQQLQQDEDYYEDDDEDQYQYQQNSEEQQDYDQNFGQSQIAYKPSFKQIDIKIEQNKILDQNIEKSKEITKNFRKQRIISV